MGGKVPRRFLGALATECGVAEGCNRIFWGHWLECGVGWGTTELPWSSGYSVTYGYNRRYMEVALHVAKAELTKIAQRGIIAVLISWAREAATR